MDSIADRLEVKRMELGRGVFTSEALGADELVGEVDGAVIEDPDYSSNYSVELSRHAVLEPAEPFRFLNHSCEPNCELILWRYRRLGRRRYYRVWLQTLRAIAPGEELTIDYAWPASAAIPCACGSSKCRGWIVSEDELDQLLVTRGGNAEFDGVGQRQFALECGL